MAQNQDSLRKDLQNQVKSFGESLVNQRPEISEILMVRVGEVRESLELTMKLLFADQKDSLVQSIGEELSQNKEELRKHIEQEVSSKVESLEEKINRR